MKRAGLARNFVEFGIHAEVLPLAGWLAASTLAVLVALVSGWLGVLFALGGGFWVAFLCLRARSSGAAASGAAQDSLREHPSITRAAAAWCDRYELLWLLAASPLFLFPQPATIGVTLLLPALWLNRKFVRGSVTAASPLNFPVLLLLLMLIPAFLVAQDRELALPKLAGILFGVALYFAILNLRPAPPVYIVLAVICGLSITLACIGFVGTDWPTGGKLSIYAAVYQSLPRLVRNVPRSTGGGINPNEMGGTLAWLIPVLVAAWLSLPWPRLPQPAGSALLQLAERGLLIVAIVLCSVLLFLTQSRGAIFAVVAALLLLSAVLSRRARLVIGLLLAGGLVVFAYGAVTGAGIALGDWVSSPVVDPLGASLVGRWTIWQWAVQLIQRYPVTGVGLFNFAFVVQQQLDPQLPLWVSHAHNLFLQAAVDLGLPGLVAYGALLVCAYAVIWNCARSRQASARKALALALCFGLAAILLAGLTDTIPLGQKPGFIFWVYLGLAARLGVDTS